MTRWGIGRWLLIGSVVALAGTTLSAPSLWAVGAAPTALPGKVDLRPWTVPVADQGELQSSTAWAVDYAMLGWYSRRDAKAGQPFAPMFSYAQLSGGLDAGASLTDTLDLAKSSGTDTLSDYSQGNYDYTDQPTVEQQYNAGNYKISDWHHLFASAGQGRAAVSALKTALAAGQPVALGIPIRPGFDNIGHGAKDVDDDTTGVVRGLQSVLAVGYNRYGVLVQNSWGTAWANKGFGRLSWSVIKKDAYEADVIDGFAVPTIQHAGTRTLLLSPGVIETIRYGNAGDVPLTGDWNGDGIDTPGVFRDGNFYLRNENTDGSADFNFPYGSPGDIPVVGDWNGDGIDTIGVVRGSTWYLRNSNTFGAADLQFTYGNAGDIPVVGDWDGDGTDTIGVVRGSTWYLSNFNGHGAASIKFGYGDPGDARVIGDWNGDGVDTPGVVRGNVWYIRNSNTSGTADDSFTFGDAGSVPLAGDYSGGLGDRPSMVS